MSVVDQLCPDCKKSYSACQCNEEWEEQECGWPGCGCGIREACDEVKESLDVCQECGGELSWYRDGNDYLRSFCDECDW